MRDFIERDLPKLLDLLYDAALDSTCWQTFLDALPGCFGGATGVMHYFDAETGTMSVSAGFGHDPAFAASYGCYYSGVNPYPPVGFRKLPVGKVAYSSSVLPVETVERTEFFNDWMKPQGIPSDHFGLLLCNNRRGSILLGLAPHVSVYSKSRRTYAAQLQLLAPHITRAIEINRVTSVARLAERALGGTLEALGVAAFLVGRSGRLLLANTDAEALMRAERVVGVDKIQDTASHERGGRQGAVAGCSSRCDGDGRPPPAAAAVDVMQLGSPLRCLGAAGQAAVWRNAEPPVRDGLRRAA